MATIVHAASYGNPAPGSFIHSIVALCRALVEDGHRFVLVVRAVRDASWHAQIEEAGGFLIVAHSAADAARKVHALRADIVHTHFIAYDVSIAALEMFSKSRIFWHAHGEAGRTGVIGTLRRFVKYKLVARRVDALVPVSAAAAQSLMRCGVCAEKITVVRNGIDTRHFRPPSADERNSARAAFGFHGSERVVLFFGRDPWIKGGDTLLAALKGGAGASLLLVGAPAVLRDAFAAGTHVVEVERVDDTRPLYWAADVLAFPSRTEGFGYVLVEALCCNVPAVASDLPVTREITQQRGGAILVAAQDGAALRDGLARAQDLPTAVFWQNYARDYSNERWVQDMRALYGL